jgi:hypothetical protein
MLSSPSPRSAFPESLGHPQVLACRLQADRTPIHAGSNASERQGVGGTVPTVYVGHVNVGFANT